ncbi:hypothetical protein EYF80_059611 [Liparis tanakae]|uniref:Uncharacterized protein n=1 Tax=Liparis tanakae TaxID=230148 RepID=A0A4Z2EMX3_9TELE|nr:hypothetical protein EYF80_059611 [Liparis tanakae]
MELPVRLRPGVKPAFRLLPGDVAVVPGHLLVGRGGDQLLQLRSLADDGLLHGVSLSRTEEHDTTKALRLTSRSQAVEHAVAHRGVRRAQAGRPQGARQPVGVLAVELAELGGAAVGPPPRQAVRPVQPALHGVVVELEAPHGRQHVAAQAAQAAPQQEEPVGHAGQLQAPLRLRSAHAAVVERKVGRRVHGHGDAGEEGWRAGGGDADKKAKRSGNFKKKEERKQSESKPQLPGYGAAALPTATVDPHKDLQAPQQRPPGPTTKTSRPHNKDLQDPQQRPPGPTTKTCRPHNKDHVDSPANFYGPTGTSSPSGSLKIFPSVEFNLGDS